MQNTPSLSVAIITRDEAHNIEACLRSVAFANEIVVVDQASSDGTDERARAAGARVIRVDDWLGFGPQKNRAIEACRGDWILSLDADERVGPELGAEIAQVICDSAFDVYEMPRRSTYCGRFIEHAGWNPDYCRRLFRRGTARFSETRVHEVLITNRPIGRLRSPLIHYSFRSMDEVLVKINRYSSEGALILATNGETPGLGKAIFHGLAAFLRTYVLRAGFLDGRHGFMLAVSNAEGSYYKYVKAMLMAERTYKYE